MRRVLLLAISAVSCANPPRDEVASVGAAEPALRDASASMSSAEAERDASETGSASTDPESAGSPSAGGATTPGEPAPPEAAGGPQGGLGVNADASTPAPTSSGDVPPIDELDSGAKATKGGALLRDGSAEVPTLHLDPETLTFYTLPISSVRYAVGGHSAEHGLCASIIWWDEPVLCGDLTSSQVYVVLSQASGPPCEVWDYAPNVETTRADGCVDAGAWGGDPFVDVELDVSGPLFTGRVIADNRNSRMPSPVTFGLSVTSAEPATLFVQRSDDVGGVGWVRGYRAGELLAFFERPRIPDCDGGTTRRAPGFVDPFMQGALSGSVYQTWDGYLHRETDEGCEVKEPAPFGEYEVQLCFGESVIVADSGDWVLPETCVSESFSLPTELVLVETQHP